MKKILTVIFLFFCIPLFSQKELSISSLIRHFSDYPLEFKNFINDSTSFKFSGMGWFEGGLIVPFNFKDSITGMALMKGFWVTTIVASKGKGVLKDRKSEFNTYVERFKNYIQKDSVANMAFKGSFEHIEINNMSEIILDILIEEGIKNGLVEKGYDGTLSHYGSYKKDRLFLFDNKIVIEFIREHLGKGNCEIIIHYKT